LIVGIDLGTTNSLVAAWKDGAAVVIPNALGDRLTPSCVSVDDDGTVLIGRAARDRGIAKPDSSASVFKRAMGTDREYRLAGRAFRAEELSALVLRELKRDAEAFLGEPVESAVITVPAYFNDTQRKATRTAGELAGLRVERLLNEPTAAALAYGLHHRPTESRFLVFDLGGGTFDVSVLEWFEGIMEVRASTGDAFLGGEDFVEVLVNAFLEKHIEALGGRSPRPEFLAVLHESAERAKRRLSEHETATLRASLDDKVLEMDVDEERFLELARPVLDRIVAPVSRAIRDARLTVEQLDEVLLVGGATRMPLVRKLAARLFGRFPAMHVNPDDAIAMGAAVQAGLIAQDAALDEVVLTDVAPHTLGVAISKRVGDRLESGYFSPLIERNTVIPASRVGDYSPTADGQTELRFNVYQGEGRMVRDNVLLGTLDVPLPGKTRAESNINVRFTYDVSGLLEVEATLASGGPVHRLVIENNKGTLTPAQIEQRLATLESLKVLPRERADVRAVLARGERLYAERLGEERESIDGLLRDLEVVLARQSPDEIAHACEDLSRIFDEIEGKPYL
jgi:molecular chaperone HscC